MKKCWPLLVCLMVLPACKDSVGLQREYVASRDGCRELAEMKVGLYTAPSGVPVSERERNQMLLRIFSECMRGKDWAVAKPKEPAKPDAPPASGTGGGQQTAGNTPPVGNTLPISSAIVKPGAQAAAPAPTIMAAPPGTQFMLVPVVPAPIQTEAQPQVQPPMQQVPPAVSSYQPAPIPSPAPRAQATERPAATTTPLSSNLEQIIGRE